VQGLSETKVRALRVGEEEVLLTILDNTFGVFHSENEVRSLLSSARFDRNGCFIAEEDGSPVGSVAVTRLPRDNWFVIRYLAVGPGGKRAEIAGALLTRALDYAKSRSAEFIRATTPAIEPYVSIYKKHGFVPLRRDFRIIWDLGETTREGNETLKVVEVSEQNSREAAQVFVRALGPIWDWRTEEQGGPDRVADSFREGLTRGERWFLCYANGIVVGLTGIIVDYYRAGEARFRGAYVVAEHREKGIGLAVMKEALNLARKLGQHRMVVYTFSDLDCLAPGALLYLGSGGRIETEYTQLALPRRNTRE
jgi:predicted N-acetyltransferase YhbS